MAKSIVSIQSNLDEIYTFLDNLDDEKLKGSIKKNILGAVGNGAKKAVKKNYGTLLHRRSSNLYKGVTRKFVKSKQAVVITSYARGRNKQYYGPALAKGALIKAKNNGYLVFQINGKWIKKKEVKLPARDWVESPVNNYLKSSQITIDMNKQLVKAVQNAETKAKKKLGI